MTRPAISPQGVSSKIVLAKGALAMVSLSYVRNLERNYSQSPNLQPEEASNFANRSGLRLERRIANGLNSCCNLRSIERVGVQCSTTERVGSRCEGNCGGTSCASVDPGWIAVLYCLCWCSDGYSCQSSQTHRILHVDG